MSGPADRMGMVDSRQPRVGQAITGTLLLTGFVFDVRIVLPVLAGVLGAAVLLGPRFNPYALLFRFLRQTGALGPPRELEEAAPPRFANALGFVFLTVATVAAYPLGPAGRWVAWGLALLVAGLALLAAITGLCVGCELYVVGRRVLTGGRAPGRIVREEAGTT